MSCSSFPRSPIVQMSKESTGNSLRKREQTATKLECSLPTDTRFNQDTVLPLGGVGSGLRGRGDVLPPTLSEDTFPRYGL